jgi:hypothetical protein
VVHVIAGQQCSTLTSYQPTRAFSIRIGIDLDIFKTLSEDGEAPKSSAQLAAPKNADPLLVGKAIADLKDDDKGC